MDKIIGPQAGDEVAIHTGDLAGHAAVVHAISKGNSKPKRGLWNVRLHDSRWIMIRAYNPDKDSGGFNSFASSPAWAEARCFEKA
jgi:hypothetical protein